MCGNSIQLFRKGNNPRERLKMKPAYQVTSDVKQKVVKPTKKGRHKNSEIKPELYAAETLDVRRR